MAPTITFGESAAESVAEQLGLKEKDGVLVDKESEKPEIPSDSDEPMTLEEFAGAAKGSRVFIKKDFNSLSAYVEQHRQDDE
ncbi:hypothetical protein [Halarchaeum nitratireducens]|uniref:Uncharacterized protein n=1 Tax=Halarchaeum nitratireducens TaxID=489913 RepID=A0A830GBD1_9EURY|nr:hypothetical protein [Halarchaeum nitratireducens]GGN18761.1 hypothetical protein GCM10009021_19780 [Halarchaeum nitratireducens]